MLADGVKGLRQFMAALVQAVAAGLSVRLAIPRGTNTVVYTHFKDSVWRQADTNAPWSRALAGVRASRMEPDARAHVTAWRWELELAVKDERKKTRPLFTFLSVAPAATQPEKQP